MRKERLGDRVMGRLGDGEIPNCHVLYLKICQFDNLPLLLYSDQLNNAN